MNILGGVIFDWDGVIVDSSFAHEKSWEMLADKENLFLPEDHFERWFGIKSDTIIRDHLKWASDPTEISRLYKLKEHYYQDVIKETGLELLPGVRKLLAELKNAGIKTAVGTSTPKGNLDLALKLLNLQGQFNALITAQDVTQGKPHPEVFLKAAAAIDCSPQNCVVFEDAPQGINAGLTAGMFVIGLLTTRSSDQLSGAQMIMEDLSEVSLKHIMPTISGQLNSC